MVLILDSIIVGLASALVGLCSVPSLPVIEEICDIALALVNEVELALRERECM